METQPLISVIVPVFNVEKFLRQCIESVLAQTYSCLELILIDDASTDGSADLCKQLAACDRRIRFLQHDTNRGQGAARNLGLDNARGKLVTFLDSDDMLLPDSLQDLLQVMETTRAPIVCGQYRRFVTELPGFVSARQSKSYTLGRTEALKHLLYQKGQPDSSVWGKLYDISLFRHERFTTGIIYEDLDIVYRLVSETDKVGVTDSCVYLYRRNPGSTLSIFNPKRLDVLDVTEKTIKYFEKNGAGERNAKERGVIKAARDRHLSAAFNILGLIYAGGTSMKATELECKKIIREQRADSLVDPGVRLKNKIGILSTYIGGFRLYRILSRFIYR